jgi:uncharacterized protein YndB with AHSA1/START domain
MLTPILVTAMVLLFVFEVMVARRPAEFMVERSTQIEAPTEQIFALVNEFKQWEQWSPWAKIDPNMSQTYEGPAAGVGSRHTWSGNSKAGAGSQTIVESEPGSRIKIKLEFEKPFKASNDVEFIFRSESNRTKVQWIMTGVNTNFIWRRMSMFISMDSMVGKDFEKGLAQLKTLAESTPA